MHKEQGAGAGGKGKMVRKGTPEAPLLVDCDPPSMRRHPAGGWAAVVATGI